MFIFSRSSQIHSTNDDFDIRNRALRSTMYYTLALSAFFLIFLVGATVLGSEDIQSSDLFSNIYEQVAVATTALDDAIAINEASISKGVFSQSSCGEVADNFGVINMEKQLGPNDFRFRTDGKIVKCSTLRGYFRYIDIRYNDQPITSHADAIDIFDYENFQFDALDAIIRMVNISEFDVLHKAFNVVTLEAGIDDLIEFKSFSEYYVTVTRVFNSTIPVPDNYVKIAFDRNSVVKRVLVKWPAIVIDNMTDAKSNFDIALEIYNAIVGFSYAPENLKIKIDPVIAETIKHGESVFNPAVRVATSSEHNAGIEFDILMLNPGELR